MKDKEISNETSQCLSFNNFLYWSTPLSLDINIDIDDDNDDEFIFNKASNNNSKSRLDNFYYEEKNKLFNTTTTATTTPTTNFEITNKTQANTNINNGSASFSDASSSSSSTLLKSSTFNAQINFSSLITTTRFLNLNHSPLTRQDSTLSVDSLSSNNFKYGNINESKLSLNTIEQNNVETIASPYANKRNSLLAIDTVTTKQANSREKRNSIQIDGLKEASNNK